MRLRTLFFASLVLAGGITLAGSLTAAAQSDEGTAEPLACVAETEGIATCYAGKVCECIYVPAAAAQARPAHFRWDCGILRPSCHVPGADAPSHYYYRPPLILHHRRDDDTDDKKS